MTQDFRPLQHAEERLVRHLLAIEFPGKAELVGQLPHAEVRTVDEDGSLQFRVVHGKPAQVLRRVPVSGSYEDEDDDGVEPRQVLVCLMIHVLDGWLDELEIFKEDGSKILVRPDQIDLREINVIDALP